MYNREREIKGEERKRGKAYMLEHYIRKGDVRKKMTLIDALVVQKS
jgi:hypothetical protein